MTPGHAGVQLFPMTAVCFRMSQFRMFRMLGMIEHTALYRQNPDIRYAYVCAVHIRNRINTDGPALVMPDGVVKVYFFHLQKGDSDKTCNLTKNE